MKKILKRIFVTLQNKVNNMKNIFEKIIEVFLFIVMVSLGTFLTIWMMIFIYVIVTGVHHELFK